MNTLMGLISSIFKKDDIEEIVTEVKDEINAEEDAENFEDTNLPIIKRKSKGFFDEFYAIDFETATKKRSSACSLGIVHVVNEEIVDSYSFIFQPPNNAYDRQNIAIHRIFPSQTENEPTIEAYYNQIFNLLDGSYVVAHNASFDRSVLTESLEYYGLKVPSIKDWQCTYAIAGGTLEDCCKKFAIDLNNHHDPLCDAAACAQLYIKLAELARKSPAEKKKDKESEIASKIDTLLSGIELPDESIFVGKNILITGVFHNFLERELLCGILKKCGAKVKSSISKKTDIVIYGEMPGPSKMDKIQQLNNSGEAHIELMNEDNLIQIFEQNHIKYKF